MKEVYCKYCGLELENGECSCKEFKESASKNVNVNKVCDTCQKKIDDDSIFCPYCGMPLNVDGNISELKKELAGEGAADVLEVYENRETANGVKKKRKKGISLTFVFSALLIAIIIAVTTTTFLMPFIKQKIADYQLKKMLETVTESDLKITPTSDKVVEYQEETTQPVIDLKDTWVKRDGYFYAFDENGDPVVDDWVTETDENGEEKKYYFDIDGKLVVNSWINGEYFVGADGAMYRNQSTPDGAFVDEDGRVYLQGADTVAVEKETFVYYEGPNSSETVAATTQKSGLSGEIKGVDPNKKYELYIKNIKQQRDTVTKGDLKCNVTYYQPIFAGANEREVNIINENFERVFGNDFKEHINEMIKDYGELPKSVTFTTVEQRNVTSNKVTILLHGKLLPRKGLSEKKKFRFVYDRKSKQLMIANISD